MAPTKAEANLELHHIEQERKEKRNLLAPRVLSVVSALGGFEDVLVPGEGGEEDRLERVYQLGDECLGCLKDLKKYWRLDDHDDDRTVARILFESKVLPNDLLPILLAVDGTERRGTRLALLCSDLIAALTWPIDVAAELREAADLDDEEEARHTARVNYSGLIAAQLSYKRDILRSGALEPIFKLIIPALEKSRRDRTSKDENIISLVLHIIRNLAALRDRKASHTQSAAAAEESYLQSEFILQLQKYQVWDFLIILTHKSKADFLPWNLVALDIMHLLFHGIDVGDLVAAGASKGPKGEVGGRTINDRKLEMLLEGEEDRKRREARKGVSRHSRFGTTLSVQTGGKRFNLHHQSAITAPVEQALDVKKKVTKKAVAMRADDDLAPPVEIKPAAMRVLREVAVQFLESGFNPFFAQILSDIRMERQKVREADTVRFLYLLRLFLSFSLHLRAQETEAGIDPRNEEGHDFDLIAEMTEPGALGFVTMRMKGCMEEKPVLVTELHAGVDCLIQMLLVIDELAKTGDEELIDAAAQLQNRLYYEGETLDLVAELLAKYSKQSLKYLDSIVHLAFVLLRMLEKYSKSKDHMFIRKKRKGKGKQKKKGANGEDEDGEAGLGMDEEEMEVEEGTTSYAEHAFRFEMFEARFADEAVLKTLIFYLRGHENFTDPEQMKRVVKLMHRQAVNAKRDTIFFKVSVLDLLNKILEGRKNFPRQTAYDDLAKLIDFIVKRFFKTVRTDPFALIQVFFPTRKSRYEDSMQADAPSGDESKAFKVRKPPAEIEVRPGFSWSQQVGIAIGLLVDNNRAFLLDHIKDALRNASATRTGIVLVTDGMPEDEPIAETEEEMRAQASKPKGPSEEAKSKFEDYIVDHDDGDTKTSRTRDAQLRLLMRLIGWESEDDPESANLLLWKIPKSRLPTEIDADIKIIDYYLVNPLDHDGKSAADLVRKKRKPRAKKVREIDDEEADGLLDSDEEPQEKKRKKRSAKRKDEAKAYKSAQFINDSDDDDDDERDKAFFEREKQLRARITLAANEQPEVEPPKARPRPKPIASKRKKAPKTKKPKTSRLAQRGSDVDMEEIDELASSSSDEDSAPAPKTARESSVDSAKSAKDDENGDVDQQQRSTTPASSAMSPAGRKRSLSAASIGSEPATAPAKASKARRVILDSDDDE